MTVFGKPNVDAVGEALAVVWKWAIENGNVDIDVEENELVEIVAQYEGYVEPEPFVPVVEPEPEPEPVAVPVFVERRKQVAVS